jgi:hypothetical protein
MQPPVVTGWVSLRAYARHRKCQPAAVSVAAHAGRLVKSVRKDATGRVSAINVEVADQEWAANSDYTDAPQRAPDSVRTPPPVDSSDPFADLEPGALAPLAGDPTAHAGMSLSEASAVEKVWKAKSAEISFREAAGELVDRDDVTNRFTAHVVAIRNKLAGLPTRAKQQLPHLSLSDIAALELIVREALEDAASGDE